MKVRRCAVVMAVLFGLAAAASADDSWFLVQLALVPAEAEPGVRVRAEHAAWLNRHVEARVVTMAGRLDDGTEMLLLRAASKGDAIDISNTSPTVRAGYHQAIVSHWDLHHSVMRVIRPPQKPARALPDRFRIEGREEAAPINLERSE